MTSPNQILIATHIAMYFVAAMVLIISDDYLQRTIGITMLVVFCGIIVTRVNHVPSRDNKN